MRDVLQSGNQPVGAIGATTDTCPPSIRPHVRLLFARLSAGLPAELAFRHFADDMDEPLADLVAVGLLIAVSRGVRSKLVSQRLRQCLRTGLPCADPRRLWRPAGVGRSAGHVPATLAISDSPSGQLMSAVERLILATLLGVLNAPASKLVRVLNEPASALARSRPPR